jgi:uncharacterized LabA/DUF88 family protein
MRNGHQQFALLMDFENLIISLENSAPEAEKPFNLNRTLRFLEDRYGQVVYRKAIADWGNPTFRKYAVDLQRSGVEMQHVVRIGYNAKNTADTYLVLEAMACVLQYPDIGGYIIATGDVDFLPLITRLKATGRKVIGMGAEGAIANSLLQNCDEYICCGTDGLAVKDRLASDTGAVVNALRAVFQDQESLSLDELEEALRRELPGFTPADYGATDLPQLLGGLRNFVSLDGTTAAWEGPRSVRQAQTPPPADGELSFEDYMHNTRWFVSDPDLRDRVLRAIFHTLSDGFSLEVSDLRAAVDPNEEMSDKQWFGTLFSLKCGGGLYEHPDNGDHAISGRRVSLFRGVEHEDEFRARYYTSLFHKAYGERDDITPELCAELLYGDEAETKTGLFQDVFARLARRR